MTTKASYTTKFDPRSLPSPTNRTSSVGVSLNRSKEYQL